ncbi:MAG: hypothetical protein CBB70_05485 [Planctomycetaceae bacterium TMED10]|nr:MAG: hypothetical protein CBB70_05485 [Planctomycetaceae bacterium TMED10]
MAGAGFKNFTDGSVLTAAEVNTYLMEQTVMVFADATARDAAVTSPTEGMNAYLKDTNSLVYYDGSVWAGWPVGDVTGVTAGNGLQGGGSAGEITIGIDTDTKGDLVVGTGADTSTKLGVGTDTHILTADSTTASGLAWSAPNPGDVTGVTAGNGLQGGGTSGDLTIGIDTDALGDLVVGTGADTSTKLTVGSDTQVLTADSTTASGLAWATQSSGVTTGKAIAMSMVFG